jgi:hypothetical protein
VPDIENLYKAYKDKVEFLLIYIREAHPSRSASSGRPVPNRFSRVHITQHKNIEERIIAATKCVRDLKISLPTLIDDMAGTFQSQYGGFPAGTTIVDLEGKVLFTSRGPTGAKPRDAERIFKALATQGKLVAPKPKKPAKPAAPTTAPVEKQPKAPAEKPAPSPAAPK